VLGENFFEMKRERICIVTTLAKPDEAAQLTQKLCPGKAAAAKAIRTVPDQQDWKVLG